MIDRSWVMKSRVGETVQSHGDVAPQKRRAPLAEDSRLGGAGITAAAIDWENRLRDLKIEVHLFSSYSAADRLTFERLGLGSRKKKNSPKLYFHRIAGPKNWTPSTTIKFRIFESQPQGSADLKFRFDQDAEGFDWRSLPKDHTYFSESLCRIDSFDTIVVSDFNKNLVNRSIIREINSKYSSSKNWLVDTKSPELLEEIFDIVDNRKITVFLNRDETIRYFKHKSHLGDNSVHTELAALPFRWAREHFLEMARRILIPPACEAKLVIKLDKDGAFAVWADGKNAWFVEAKPDKDYRVDGISAGDLFLSGWLSLLIKHGDNAKPKDLIREAAGRASCWLSLSNKTFWDSDDFKSGSTDIPTPHRHLSVEAFRELRGTPPALPFASLVGVEEPKELTRELAEIAARRDFPNLLKKGDRLLINTRDAESVLDGYLTIDPGKIQKIRSVLLLIDQYLKSPSQRRPLNFLVGAKPGSGKSFLIRKIAEYLKMEFSEINVSQMPDIENLLQAISRIAHKGDGPQLVIIDEFVSQIQNSHCFSSLLSPLWDSKILIKGEEITLPRKCVFMLADSTGYNSESKPDLIVDTLKRENKPKGVDLLSRINGGIVFLDELSVSDNAYLVASLLKRYHGSIKQVEFCVFDVLSNFVESPRELEYIVSSLAPRDGELRAEDVIKSRSPHIARNNFVEKMGRLAKQRDAESDFSSDKMVGIIGKGDS